MVKNFTSIILLLLTIMTGSLIGLPPAMGEEPKIRADAAILMDYQTGQVLFAKRGWDRMHPASTTKIVTTLIALEQGNLEDRVVVSSQAGSMNLGSSLRLRSGDQITLGNLLKGALMLSANDSTVAIAQHLAGDADLYVQMMNKKAVAIGALNTQFVNTNGFSKPNHYTTAFDLALMARYAMHNPAFARQVGTQQDTVKWVSPEKEMEVNNTNKLLWMYPGTTGIKTGTTSAAGGCLVSSAVRDGRTLIAVVLRSSRRYQDSITLFDYGFLEVKERVLLNSGQIISTRPVVDGILPKVKILPVRSVKKLVSQAELAQYTTKIYLPRQIKAPLHKGQKLGHVVVMYQGKEISQVPLVAAESIKKKFILQRLWEKL